MRGCRGLSFKFILLHNINTQNSGNALPTIKIQIRSQILCKHMRDTKSIVGVCTATATLSSEMLQIQYLLSS